MGETRWGKRVAVLVPGFILSLPQASSGAKYSINGKTDCSGVPLLGGL